MDRNRRADPRECDVYSVGRAVDHPRESVVGEAALTHGTVKFGERKGRKVVDIEPLELDEETVDA